MSSNDGSKPSPTSKNKKSAKVVSQIMAALKNSGNNNGPTTNDIVKFINGSITNPATKRQILTALKRGVQFGVLKRKRGRYQISSADDDFPPKQLPMKKAPTKARRARQGSSKIRKRRRITKARRTRAQPDEDSNPS